MRAYRIVEVKDGALYTLFHGLRGSRRLPLGQWLDAEVRPVQDRGHGKRYQSGFHVLPSRAIAERFLGRFHPARDLRIIEVIVEGLRPKPTNGHVLLARRMYVPAATTIQTLEQRS